MKLKLFVFIGSIFFTSVAFGASFKSTINSISPYGDGDFLITFTDDQGTACTSGKNPKTYRVEVDQYGVTEAGANKILSVALAAATTGKAITAYFDESSPKCYINLISLKF